MHNLLEPVNRNQQTCKYIFIQPSTKLSLLFSFFGRPHMYCNLLVLTKSVGPRQPLASLLRLVPSWNYINPLANTVWCSLRPGNSRHTIRWFLSYNYYCIDWACISSCPACGWDSSIPTPVTTDLQTYKDLLLFWHQRATPETCDHWDIWSEWWRDMTRQKQLQEPRQIQIQRQWQRQIHLEISFNDRSKSLVTFETFDQSEEEIWPDQKKDNG